MKPNHKCWVCGKEYYACDDCDKGTAFHWRSIACSTKCFQIYYIMQDYNKDKNASEALQKLKSIGVSYSDISKYTLGIQGFLKEIFTVQPAPPKRSKYNQKEVEQEDTTED